MPTIIDRRDNGSGTAGNLQSVNFSYDYPKGNEGQTLNWKPGSELHEKIRAAILQRVRDSRMQMQKKYKTWRECDRTVTAFVDLDEEEKRLKEKDPRKPLSIVVPMSYAVKQTLETYMVAIFLRDPIFSYDGVGPEDVRGATLLEKLIQMQCSSPKAKVEKSLINMFGGAFTHGIGAASIDWKVVNDKRRITNENTDGSTSVVPVPNVAFEGNYLRQIDNYNFFPDPNVSIDNVQEGEFVSWSTRSNVMALLGREKSGTEDLFNCKYLKVIDARSQLLREDGREARRDSASPLEMVISSNTTKAADELIIYWNLIPSEWGLGDSDYPEKWCFILVGDQVVVKASPLNLDHDMYPLAVMAPGCDGFTLTPTSEVEIVSGLQKFLDFIFSSHIANRRKILNDMLVVDPSLINMKDLVNPGPGKLIRMRRSAWGRGVKDAVNQLAVTDITERSIPDAFSLMDMVQRLSGAQDSVMGIVPGGERRSSAEFTGTRNAALSRLEKIARVMGIQAMKDIGYIFARHNQQLLSHNTWVRSMGDWEQELQDEYGNDPYGRVPVNLQDIMVDFDVNVEYGSMPGTQDPQAWIQVLQTVAQSPTLSTQIDLVRVFMHTARLMGAKEISQFRLPQAVKTKVVSDTEAMAQAQSGNIVPVGGASNAA